MDNCGTSLQQILESTDDITIEQRLQYVIQICESLQCLHNLGINHLDIKPSNIIIDGQNTAKLIDFGLSMFNYLPDPTKSPMVCFRGSPKYIPFEIVIHKICSKQSDIFSLGLTIMLILGLYDIVDYMREVPRLNTLYNKYFDDIHQNIDKSILDVFVDDKIITETEHTKMKKNIFFNVINSLLIINKAARPTIDVILLAFINFQSKMAHE
jgi:serine/threonine protein kinase